ncbi:Ppx/GppA phosphatase family protein [Saccharopolyspora endophytica]|uniref:Exopolyphosphatase n=1 Tax=Saccharopolyspora endophytica TaxID=543886 RepID=A0ABS5DEE2_9PSEU|nr:exopolyphosphatase [Saccharopolyspora endophytica]MBQ0924641.1 exopolyphosphatase [Saccharopolyspora endophytica]
MRLAMLDIGSAAARLDIVDLASPRMPRATWSVKSRTRLAEHTLLDGRVTEEGIADAERAVRHCVSAASDKPTEALIAYGTSAVRDASNGARLRKRLGEAAGVRIGVLTPRDEAAVAYHAARRWHGRSGRAMTTVDIGGGTLDVATGTGTDPDLVVSLQHGAARLTRQFLPDDPPTPAQLADLRHELHATIPKALRRVEGGHPLALSKVLRQLAVLTESSPDELARRPHRLRLKRLSRWIPRLAELDHEQRAKLPGVSRSRGRRILAGAIVAEVIMESLELPELEICPWGLRQGLVYRFLEARTRTRADALDLVGTLFD